MRVPTSHRPKEQSLLVLQLDEEIAAITDLVLRKFGRDLLCELNSLSGHGCAAYIYGVGIDVTACRAPIAIADLPGLTRELLGCGGRCGVIYVVAVLICGR